MGSVAYHRLWTRRGKFSSKPFVPDFDAKDDVADLRRGPATAAGGGDTTRVELGRDAFIRVHTRRADLRNNMRQGSSPIQISFAKAFGPRPRGVTSLPRPLLTISRARLKSVTLSAVMPPPRSAIFASRDNSTRSSCDSSAGSMFSNSSPDGSRLCCPAAVVSWPGPTNP
jgi:hypothetical protein